MRPNIQAISGRYQELRAVEDGKDKIIEDLLADIKQLDSDFEKAKDDYDDLKRVAASLREDNKKHQDKIDAMKREQGKLSFASVIVDGDGMNFLESLVQDGKVGGDKAARRLIEASDDHVQNTEPAAPSNTCYKIRVYANVAGLTKAYRADKLLADDQDLTSFIQGFNKAHPLCDFVDVGDGKECSDVKIRALLERDHADVHCNRILFCASADNGYAPVLRQYRDSDKISLVEGPPFAREMKELASDFQTTSFPRLFMSRKLNETRRVPSGSPSTAQVTSIIPTGSPKPNYASAAARPAPILQFPIPLAKDRQESLTSLKLSLCVNDLDQRVDLPLKVSSKQSVASLKARKLCNMHHILRSCPYDSCNHDHNFAPSRQEVIDLMFIARSSPCFEGPACRDVTCISGHRCAFGASCSNKQECRFDSGMHDVRTVGVKTIEEYQIS